MVPVYQYVCGYVLAMRDKLGRLSRLLVSDHLDVCYRCINTLWMNDCVSIIKVVFDDTP